MNNLQTNIRTLSSVDIRAVAKEGLIDVSGLTFESNLRNELRPAKILQDTGNPYCFRVGDLAVKLEFPDDAPPLQDVFFTFLQRKKGGL